MFNGFPGFAVMSLSVFFIVMFAALLHATWNAIVKKNTDKILITVLVTTGAAIISALILPFLKQPQSASWIFILISAMLQIIYYILIARVYHLVDMSLGYPLMRGSAPFIVAILSASLLGESLSLMAWLGIGVICLGILSMALDNHHEENKDGLRLILFTAIIIAAYTMVDGIGVRRSGAPITYTLWIFLLTGLPMGIGTFCMMPDRFKEYIRHYWMQGLIGGGGTTASYGLALWAMTVAPVAMIAALRETSILFGSLISWIFLKEPATSRRVMGVCIILVGAMMLRMS